MTNLTDLEITLIVIDASLAVFAAWQTWSAAVWKYLYLNKIKSSKNTTIDK